MEFKISMSGTLYVLNCFIKGYALYLFHVIILTLRFCSITVRLLSNLQVNELKYECTCNIFLILWSGRSMMTSSNWNISTSLAIYVRGIHRSPVNSPHKSQWRRDLMVSLVCSWINGWVNSREAGDLGCYRAHYDVIVMASDSIAYGHMLGWSVPRSDNTGNLIVFIRHVDIGTVLPQFSWPTELSRICINVNQYIYLFCFFHLHVVLVLRAAFYWARCWSLVGRPHKMVVVVSQVTAAVD